MRLDLFMKAVGLLKTRPEAKRAAEAGLVRVDGRRTKPSHEVKPGEVLEIDRPPRPLWASVLAVPRGKSVPRSERSLYIRVERHREPVI